MRRLVTSHLIWIYNWHRFLLWSADLKSSLFFFLGKGSFTQLEPCYNLPCIGLDKRGYQVNIFLISHENIHCGYSLEAPRRGASNEYPQHMFLWRNTKNINTFGLKKAPYLELWGPWRANWATTGLHKCRVLDLSTKQNCSRQHAIFLILFFRENKTWHMWIIC